VATKKDLLEITLSKSPVARPAQTEGGEFPFPDEERRRAERGEKVPSNVI